MAYVIARPCLLRVEGRSSERIDGNAYPWWWCGCARWWWVACRYSMALKACELLGRWEQGLDLMARMKDQGLPVRSRRSQETTKEEPASPAQPLPIVLSPQTLPARLCHALCVRGCHARRACLTQ